MDPEVFRSQGVRSNKVKASDSKKELHGRKSGLGVRGGDKGRVGGGLSIYIIQSHRYARQTTFTWSQ